MQYSVSYGTKGAAAPGRVCVTAFWLQNYLTALQVGTSAPRHSDSIAIRSYSRNPIPPSTYSSGRRNTSPRKGTTVRLGKVAGYQPHSKCSRCMGAGQMLGNRDTRVALPCTPPRGTPVDTQAEGPRPGRCRLAGAGGCVWRFRSSAGFRGSNATL